MLETLKSKVERRGKFVEETFYNAYLRDDFLESFLDGVKFNGRAVYEESSLFRRIINVEIPTHKSSPHGVSLLKMEILYLDNLNLLPDYRIRLIYKKRVHDASSILRDIIGSIYVELVGYDLSKIVTFSPRFQLQARVMESRN